MERFKVITPFLNDKIRLNLYNICRLCGIDNPSKIKILDSLKIPNDSDEEPCLSKKIECVVGIKVKRNDQMPQSICTLCADKINDFFEYREMCGATNIQTRKLLGIPLEVTKRKKLTNDKDVKVEESILGLGIEDEDITDNKSSVKSTKHRVKARPKKKGNSSKKKVYFKDEEVKVESEEIKTELQSVKINSKTISKRLKVDLKRTVDPTPLLTQKEPNKRERRREIDAQKLERRRIREEQKREIEEKKREIELAKQILEQKKLEKKRKRKSSDPEPPVKKLKQELVDVTTLHSCGICMETFATSDLLLSHLYQSHTVAISTYGCSSCAESFKTSNEEKDHELWHTLSKTSYICPICNVAFDKTSIFTRHISLCKPFNLTPTVTNIHCDQCSQEFLTQNLYQWHSCFVKPNGKCWHCNRIFVKASTLFKHSFKCSSSQSTDTQQHDHIAGDAKKNRKIRATDRDSHIKSEPEANLDMDVSASHVLTSDMLPVVVLTKTIFKPNQSVAVVNAEDVSIKTENDFDFDDNLQMDEPFRDADDSDDNEEAEPMNGVGSAMDGMDATDAFSDDDVILIENNEEEPVLVNGSPSAIRTVMEKPPFVLPIVIKREPVDNYEVSATPPIFDPAKKIKTEPLDDRGDVSNEVDRQFSPKRRRSKKSTHKSYKDRQHLVHIKQEPIDSDDLRNDIFRMAPKHNLGSAIVSLPTTNLLETTIKQEPIRCGYGDDFDPVLAMNIKKEPGLDDSGSSRLPSLRLIISKKHGTLNAKLISAQGNDADANVETSPKSTKSKRVKDKRLYKKPALLAEKIRQEMIARMARDKGNKTTSQPSADASNDFIVPVIARVLDATTISDLPLVRVKVEPKSPCHSPYHNAESILDSLCSEPIPSASPGCRGGDPMDPFRYDQFGDDIDALRSNDDADCISAMASFNELERCFNDAERDTRESAADVGSVNMEQISVATESDEMKSSLDIESLCQLRPIGGGGGAETAIRTDITDSYCESEQISATRSSDSDATNAGLIELAGMTLNEYMKQGSSEESNGHLALESTDFSSQTSSSVLIENHHNNFDSLAFDESLTVVDKNTFKIPGEHKVSYEVINEIISTLPLSTDQHMAKDVNALNSTVASTVVLNDLSNASDILSSKEKADVKSTFSDSSESNKINYSNVNAHSRHESHVVVENSGICNELTDNAKLKSTEQFLANGDDDVENELLKSPVNDNADYELNSVQTLTTSAIHEQLHSLLEDISEDSLSCDIDLDDKTVDWEWESKLLGD